MHDLVKRFECASFVANALDEKTVHDGIKYPCLQGQYEAKKKTQLTLHMNAIHLKSTSTAIFVKTFLNPMWKRNTQSTGI